MDDRPPDSGPRSARSPATRSQLTSPPPSRAEAYIPVTISIAREAAEATVGSG
jgi:hypothetical protein